MHGRSKQQKKRFKRSAEQIAAQRSPKKQKFLFYPGRYKDARPQSPRKLRVAHLDETNLYLPRPRTTSQQVNMRQQIKARPSNVKYADDSGFSTFSR